jgi:hypothetical protein
MNYKSILRGLTLAVAIVFVQPACDLCRDCAASKFKVTGYEFTTIQAGISPYDQQVSFYDGPVTAVGSGDTIQFDYLGFQFFPQIVFLSMNDPGSTSSAYATSPIPNEPTQEIDSIQVFSNRQFVTADKTYEAGTLLNEVFDVDDGTFESIDHFLSVSPQASEHGFLLTISKAVSAIQQHQFSFHITLSDSLKFQLTSVPLVIKPD